jgi:hypothetical protein
VKHYETPTLQELWANKAKGKTRGRNKGKEAERQSPEEHLTNSPPDKEESSYVGGLGQNKGSTAAAPFCSQDLQTGLQKPCLG